MGKVVVLDGPAGSGKSTTASELAKKLDFVYLDTGAMYRAVTLKILRLGKDIIEKPAEIRQLLADTRIEIKPAKNILRILLDGEDVTDDVRSSEVDGFVSEVAAVDEVREFLQQQQRRIGENFNIVAEGRDLGTYVFPNADIKIFLTADLDIRARRRLEQADGNESQLGRFRDNLAKRDRIDSGRKHSPLKKADDAIEIDTTNLSFEQQVNKILEICRQKLK